MSHQNEVTCCYLGSDARCEGGAQILTAQITGKRTGIMGELQLSAISPCPAKLASRQILWDGLSNSVGVSVTSPCDVRTPTAEPTDVSLAWRRPDPEPGGREGGREGGRRR